MSPETVIVEIVAALSVAAALWLFKIEPRLVALENNASRVAQLEKESAKAEHLAKVEEQMVQLARETAKVARLEADSKSLTLSLDHLTNKIAANQEALTKDFSEVLKMSIKLDTLVENGQKRLELLEEHVFSLVRRRND